MRRLMEFASWKAMDRGDKAAILILCGILAVTVAQVFLGFLVGNYSLVEASFATNEPPGKNLSTEKFASLVDARLRGDYPRFRSRPLQLDVSANSVTVRVIVRHGERSCATLAGAEAELNQLAMETKSGKQFSPSAPVNSDGNAPKKQRPIVLNECRSVPHSWFKPFDLVVMIVLLFSIGFWLVRGKTENPTNVTARLS